METVILFQFSSSSAGRPPFIIKYYSLADDLRFVIQTWHAMEFPDSLNNIQQEAKRNLQTQKLTGNWGIYCFTAKNIIFVAYMTGLKSRK